MSAGKKQKTAPLASVPAGEFPRLLVRPVGAAVVHQQHLEPEPRLAGKPGERLEQRPEVLLLVAGRNDNRYFHSLHNSEVYVGLTESQVQGIVHTRCLFRRRISLTVQPSLDLCD